MSVFVESSDALPIVSVLVAFRSGSTADPKGKEGLSRVAAPLRPRPTVGGSD